MIKNQYIYLCLLESVVSRIRCKYQNTWAVTGTDFWAIEDICYTPDGLLAVAIVMLYEKRIVLYDCNGHVVKESRLVQIPTGISYYPSEEALAVMGSDDIILLDAENLEIKRRIRLNTDGKGYKLAVLGADFVTVWEEEKYETVWISVSDKDGMTLQKWRTKASKRRWTINNNAHLAVATHEDNIYMTDSCGTLFVYSRHGDLLKKTKGDFAMGIVSLAQEIIGLSYGQLVSISHTDYTEKSRCDLPLEYEKFGYANTLAIYKNYLAVGCDKGICVYKILQSTDDFDTDQ